MKHSHRGLVMNGYPNLRIFNFIFWVVTGIFFLMGYGTFPLSNLIKRDLFKTVKGQFCMNLRLNWEETTIKVKLISCFIFFIEVFFSLRFVMNIWNYSSNQNLNMRTFSQYGGTYNRNLYTLNQTYIYFLVTIVWVFFDNVLVVVLQFMKSEIDENTCFLLHNAPWLVLIDLFFGIVVPIKHIINSRKSFPVLWQTRERCQKKSFFMSVTTIEPRRDFEPIKRTSEVKDIRNTIFRMEDKSRLETSQEDKLLLLPSTSRIQALAPIEC